MHGAYTPKQHHFIAARDHVRAMSRHIIASTGVHAMHSRPYMDPLTNNQSKQLESIIKSPGEHPSKTL